MSILNNGDYQDFAYTGTIQTFVVPKEGLYKLEGWGARGGIILSIGTAGGYGAYICGYKYLYRGDTLYLGIGGAGADSPVEHVGGHLTNGGYNGGGQGDVGTYLVPTETAGGGGCTHIATANGLMKNLSVSNVYLCASGGGGASAFGGWGLSRAVKGGNGGITTGRDGDWDDQGASLSPYVTASVARGGTQSAGGNGGLYAWNEHQVNAEWFPSGASQGSSAGSYGQGGQYGGGGGYYGGGGGVAGFHDFAQGQPDYFGACVSGAGGSSYIGGIPSITHKGIVYAPTTQEQVNYDNGKVRITLIDKTSTDIYMGDSLLIKRMNGDTQIAKMFYGDMDISIN